MIFSANGYSQFINEQTNNPSNRYPGDTGALFVKAVYLSAVGPLGQSSIPQIVPAVLEETVYQGSDHDQWQDRVIRQLTASAKMQPPSKR